MIINATHGGSNLSDHQRAVKKARLFSHTLRFSFFVFRFSMSELFNKPKSNVLFESTGTNVNFLF